MGRSSSQSSGSGLLGCISPRTATLAIAILGIILHLNTYSWLGALSSTLPDVPQRGSAPSPPASAAFVPSPDRFANSAPKDVLSQLESYAHAPPAGEDAANKNVYLPEWIAEAKAYLKAQGLSYVPNQSPAAAPDAAANKSATSGKSVEAIAPPSGRPFEAADAAAVNYQIMDEGAEDAERMQWDALRLVIGTLRWYILLSVVCCCAGVVGVLRSQLLLSRLFVLHSFLDFLLSTLSLFALALVCTYPSVRAHLCDEFGSGELQAWFSPSKTAKGSAVGSAGAQVIPSNAGVGSNGAGVGGGAGPDGIVDSSGWETLLDGVFASENCEESFRTTLVPLLLVFGLLFTAVRLQCFFLVQRFYASLLRTKVHHYGYATSSASLESGTSTPMSQLPPPEQPRERRWKDSKLLD